jgi:hypothetical protein
LKSKQFYTKIVDQTMKDLNESIWISEEYQDMLPMRKEESRTENMRRKEQWKYDLILRNHWYQVKNLKKGILTDFGIWDK